MVLVIPDIAGVDVLSGSFNGMAPEDCEGGTVIVIPVHLAIIVHSSLIPRPPTWPGNEAKFILFVHTI